MGSYRAERSSKEKNMRLGLVESVVLPAATLLDTETSPFRLSHKTTFGQTLRNVLGQNHVTVLELGVLIFLGVLNLIPEEKSQSQFFVQPQHFSSTSYLGGGHFRGGWSWNKVCWSGSDFREFFLKSHKNVRSRISPTVSLFLNQVVLGWIV